MDHNAQTSHSQLAIVVATTEEICSGGKGMAIRWGVVESPFGNCFIAQTPRGISHLSFSDDETESLEVLRGDWPAASLARDDRLARKISSEIFAARAHDFRLHVKGTPFQMKVWQALLGIPDGEVSTYGEIAAGLWMPGASRAVGSAVGANRIAWLIPCHRVIRSDGGLGGYRWGAERKRAMLAAEITPR